MTIQDMGAAGELIGGIAVIITMIYLALQIREASRQIAVTSAIDTNALMNEAFSPIYNSQVNQKIWTVGLRSPDELEEGEFQIFALFITRVMAAFDTIVESRNLRSIGDIRFENYLNFTSQFLDSPGGQAWLRLGQYNFSPEAKTALKINL